MQIRKAKEKDLESWAKMRTVLWPESSDNHRKEIEEYFSGKSIDIVDTFLLVDNTDNVVGFIELNIRNFAEGSRSPKLPYVEAWYIDKEYRGRGYGQKLMRYAEKWAKEKGYCELASDTEITNKRSIKLHKELGFEETERIVCFLKRLT